MTSKQPIITHIPQTKVDINTLEDFMNNNDVSLETHNIRCVWHEDGTYLMISAEHKQYAQASKLSYNPSDWRCSI